MGSSGRASDITSHQKELVDMAKVSGQIPSAKDVQCSSLFWSLSCFSHLGLKQLITCSILPCLLSSSFTPTNCVSCFITPGNVIYDPPLFFLLPCCSVSRIPFSMFPLPLNISKTFHNPASLDYPSRHLVLTFVWCESFDSYPCYSQRKS